MPDSWRSPMPHLLDELDTKRCRRRRTAAMSDRIPCPAPTCQAPARIVDRWTLDRKSTRLNSSHVKISYAVFCLKKKKKTPEELLFHRKNDTKKKRRQQMH